MQLEQRWQVMINNFIAYQGVTYIRGLTVGAKSTLPESMPIYG